MSVTKAPTARYTKVNSKGLKNLKRGVDIFADVIGSTLGPHGRNVIIGDVSMPFAVRDGVTIAKNLKPEDVWERMGSDMLIDASLKTVNDAGDSTTTTCLLVQGILNSLPRKFNRREVCDSLIEASKKIDKLLDMHSIPVFGYGSIDKELLNKVAIISANNNEELGLMVSDLVERLGPGGVIHMEQSGSPKTYSELKKGYNYKEGVLTPHFLYQGSTPRYIENPVVLLIEQKVTDQKHIIPIYEAWKSEYASAAGYTRPLVIIASDISGSAMDFMVENYKKGVPAICVKCPGFGLERVESMEDLKLITGAKRVFSKYTGNGIEKFGRKSGKNFNRTVDGRDEFGQCNKIYVSLGETAIFVEETEELTAKIIDYCEELDKVDLDTDSRKQFYRERKAKLKNGIGYIYVGGNSEAEINNKGMQLDDSQYASFAALDSGVVPGGGHMLIKLSSKIDDPILKKALVHPFNVLMKNSAVPKPFFRSYKSKYYKTDKVFNVKSMKWEEVNDTVVLDSTKGIRNAVKNAVSVSVEMIKTGNLIQWLKT